MIPPSRARTSTPTFVRPPLPGACGDRYVRFVFANEPIGRLRAALTYIGVRATFARRPTRRASCLLGAPASRRQTVVTAALASGHTLGRAALPAGRRRSPCRRPRQRDNVARTPYIAFP